VIVAVRGGTPVGYGEDTWACRPRCTTRSNPRLPAAGPRYPDERERVVDYSVAHASLSASLYPHVVVLDSKRREKK
jgi:hypothetical protein